MTYKTYLSLAAAVLLLLGAGLHGQADSGTLLFLGLAALSFGEAAGAYDHHTRRDIEDQEAEARLAARRLADQAKP